MILDGAIGTELQRRGVPMDYGAWCAVANKTHPDTVLRLHEDYIRAGADVITTNTFSSNRHSLKTAGRDNETRENNTRAVALAKEARDRATGGRQVFIAGSMSPYGALLEAPDLKRPTLETLRVSYSEQAKLLAEAGVDLLLLEMMRDVKRGRIIMEAAVSTGLPVWVGFSTRVDPQGTLRVRDEYSIETELTFDEVYKGIMALGGAVVAVMHTEIEYIVPTLQDIKTRWKGPMGAYPHSGHWERPDWRFENVVPPGGYLTEAKKWVQAGAQIIGGCCGIGPDHIAALKKGLPKHVATVGKR